MKHLMVALDLSEMDDHLAKYTRFFAKNMHCEKITYIHVLKDWDLTDSLRNLIDVPGGKLDELISNEIKEKLDLLEHKSDIEEEVVVTQGSTITSAVRSLAEKLHPDLIVLGNKNTYSGAGIANQRILENLKYPVLLVPETAHLQVSKLLIPIDFSHHAEKLVTTGLELANNFRAEKLALNILHLPEIFFPYIPEKLAIKEVEEDARKNFREMMEKLNLQDELECDYIKTGENGISKRIYNYAVQYQYDFLIVGAKGKNRLNIMNLGGTAQRLSHINLHIPLLIMR